MFINSITNFVQYWYFLMRSVPSEKPINTEGILTLKAPVDNQ